jgi:arginyl-tRNA synthetase
MVKRYMNEVAGRPVDPMVRRSPYADYQSGAALGLAGELGRSPREIAATVGMVSSMRSTQMRFGR